MTIARRYNLITSPHYPLLALPVLLLFLSVYIPLGSTPILIAAVVLGRANLCDVLGTPHRVRVG